VPLANFVRSEIASWAGALHAKTGVVAGARG